MKSQWLLILPVLIAVKNRSLGASSPAYCQETNVAYEGQFQTAKNTSNPAECAQVCSGNRRCTHWSWQTGGECKVLTASRQSLNKVGSRGTVSGSAPGSQSKCNNDLVGIDCHYTDTRDPVICLFPFNGDSPGNRNTSSNQHNTCQLTKKGHYWCATKLTPDNLVIQASFQTRDITCGAALNSRGEHYCTAGQVVVDGMANQQAGLTSGQLCSAPANGVPVISVKQQIADLERINNELLGIAKQAVCVEGWGPWSGWSECVQSSCDNNQSGQQTRNRSCLGQAAICRGNSDENRACNDPKPSPDCASANNKSPNAGQTSQGSTSSRGSGQSCKGRCGQSAGLGQCQCTPECVAFGDCCSDYTSTCPQDKSNSCVGKCGAAFDRQLPCQCNLNCGDHSNCCPDFSATCSSTTSNRNSGPSQNTNTAIFSNSNSASDKDLLEFSEYLLSIDENNVADKIQLNTGCTTRVGNPRDCSSSALFTRVDTSIFRKPIYSKLQALYENYDPDVRRTEDNLAQEKQEESDLLDEIMSTKAMQDTIKFLKAKNAFSKSDADFKKLLQELWFSIYSRGNRILGSSGFEHVFLGEKKDGKVQGFHNWVYFHHLEKKGQVNYLGQWRVVDLQGRGTGLAFTFTWGAEQKPFASMLVGTSPELEMSIYTTCLLVKGEQPCNLSLGGKLVEVTVHVFTRPRGVRYIASSYMDWK